MGGQAHTPADASQLVARPGASQSRCWPEEEERRAKSTKELFVFRSSPIRRSLDTSKTTCCCCWRKKNKTTEAAHQPLCCSPLHTRARVCTHTLEPSSPSGTMHICAVCLEPAADSRATIHLLCSPFSCCCCCCCCPEPVQEAFFFETGYQRVV